MSPYSDHSLFASVCLHTVTTVSSSHHVSMESPQSLRFRMSPYSDQFHPYSDHSLFISSRLHGESTVSSPPYVSIQCPVSSRHVSIQCPQSLQLLSLHTVTNVSPSHDVSMQSPQSVRLLLSPCSVHSLFISSCLHAVLTVSSKMVTESTSGCS